ncbi:MAG: flagellar protein FlaG [Propionivibrio sp.]
MSIQSIGSLVQTPVALSDAHTQAKPVRQGENASGVKDQTASSTAAGPAAPQELQEAVDGMNDFVSSLSNTLNFSIDKETGRTVVKVIDRATDEVIKQIPAEEMLAIAKAIDKLKGLLIQQKA